MITQRNAWSAFAPISEDFAYIGRRPTDEAVRTRTTKYIRDDYNRNCGKYSEYDKTRISNLIAETSLKK